MCYYSLLGLEKKTMKNHNRLWLLSLMLLALCSTSCVGTSSGLTNQFSHYGGSTEIQLASKNFKVIKHVKGASKAVFILGFGGKKEGLVAQAKEAMLKEAGLEGTSRSVINITIEQISSFNFFLIRTKRIVASGTVIEFENN